MVRRARAGGGWGGGTGRSGDGGESYTAQWVIKLIVKMIEPYGGRVFDPCCGSSGGSIRFRSLCWPTAPSVWMVAGGDQRVG
ncbi:MAG: N-6 DNA methylase [Phycisphaerae bacterium]